MAKHNEIGKQGEQIAKEYLLTKNYEVLAENWIFVKAEVDIIARIANTIVFVEVKTLTKANLNYPEAKVNKRKQNLLYSAADAFLYQIEHEGEFRFDIIAITLEPREIIHFEDAFFPTWLDEPF